MTNTLLHYYIIIVLLHGCQLSLLQRDIPTFLRAVPQGFLLDVGYDDPYMLLLTHNSHFFYRYVPTFGFGRLATMQVLLVSVLAYDSQTVS